jgi:hypothetical protein
MRAEVIVDAPARPITKSDRVPVHRSVHQTLASIGSPRTPTIETDDKRWIGGTDLGQTLRMMSVPPPAGTVAPTRSVSATRSVPPPIIPAPTIHISPEISIPTRREIRLPQPSAAQFSAEARPTLEPAPPPTPIPMPMPTPIVTPPVRVRAAPRRLTLALAVVAVVSIVVIAALTTVTTPEASVAHAPDVAAPPAEIDVGPATNIVTNPPGAEIILRGALVANSPARIARPSYESLYLLRLRGYQPQLVALSPHSPDSIRIDLQPIATTP